MIRIHVTYDEIKRIISFPKGEEVYKLRPHFILAFSDVLSGDIAPEHVTFQEFHEDFKDFAELRSDATLDNDIKIRAITLKTPKKVSVYSISSTLPPEVKPHPIKQYVRYRFWNLVCNGLIRIDVSTGTPRVKGNGSFGNNPDTIVQAEAIGFDLFHIYFKYGELKMYITSQGEGKTITAEIEQCRQPTSLAKGSRRPASKEEKEMPKNSHDKMIRIHVTHGEIKRIISFQKGGEVCKLRPHFLQTFSDVLSGDIAPEHVTFQEYLGDFKDFVELPSDATLDNDIKIRAVTLKSLKQAAQISSAEIQQDMELQRWPRLWPHCHLVYPCFPIHDLGPGSPMFSRLHPIKINTTYQLWSPVSKINDGCIERHSHNNIVNCKGNFNNGINTVMEAIDETSILTFYVALQFKDSSSGKDYVLTGNAEGEDITSTEVQNGVPLNDKCIFLPLYYWSYTMFQNKKDKTLYLGCDHTGKATLVKNADLDYPNPQALFILKRVVQVQ